MFPHGVCWDTVFVCPYCREIHGGIVADGLERKCKRCPHKSSCEYEGYADVEEKLCEKDECFFQWWMYYAPLRLKI